MNAMNSYVVTLQWHRAYCGTVYVVEAVDPGRAIKKAVDQDGCHMHAYHEITVKRIDKVVSNEL